VTDGRIMLSGHVSDNNTRYLALRIASDYAGPRTLVDRLRMGNEQ
jgi:osmotically-inducible protein OsmY